MSSLDIHPILSGLKPEFVTTIKYLYVHGNLGESAIIVTNSHSIYFKKELSLGKYAFSIYIIIPKICLSVCVSDRPFSRPPTR